MFSAQNLENFKLNIYWKKSNEITIAASKPTGCLAIIKLVLTGIFEFCVFPCVVGELKSSKMVAVMVVVTFLRLLFPLSGVLLLRLPLLPARLPLPPPPIALLPPMATFKPFELNLLLLPE
uniref:Uncharacterized protein n=1 Tax=Glossina brevipalpis TaxID=37001 RepID=A0A1A9W8Y8_9MUSC